ncbi:lipopolysaccharide assembly protein LapB [Flavobacterium sp. 9]|uniref:tetratricopeptide repeat protein n=1 Tax=Flavobacterium sp. 9 TaxID=2035198 RepID=UPI000C17596B|nr:hypothetical protein [Flavobacterium sp. 9]
MSGTLTITFKRFLLLTASIFICQIVVAQSNRSQTLDHLQYGKQTGLKPKETELKKDTSKSDGYFLKCVENATLKNNSNNSATSNEKVKYATEKKKLAYADSLILVANKSNNNSLIGSAHLSKGVIYYEFQNYGKAFDCFIKADNHTSRTDSEDLTNKVKYNIALIKYQLAYYDESISLLRETIDYFEKSDDEFYLKSLYSIGLCYIKNGSYEKCSQINQTGINAAKKLNIRKMEPYFILSDGINEYFKHNYTSAVSKLESSLHHFKNSDFKNESLASFYIGKSYLALNRKETALPYFLKVDKIFDDENYMTLELREVYKLLIEYYREKDDPVSQLHYVDQFLKADKLTNINYNHLSRRISRQYDAKQLILEQQKLTKQLSGNDNHVPIIIGLIILAIAIVCYYAFRHYTNCRTYKSNFEQLMSNINKDRTLADNQA